MGLGFPTCLFCRQKTCHIFFYIKRIIDTFPGNNKLAKNCGTIWYNMDWRDLYMRITRVEKFRKLRHDKIKRLIIYTLILPSTSIFIGYIITSLFILPSITR